MLARDRAADLDAQLEDAIAELDRPLSLAGLVGVVQDERMQVAVPGMEHVGAGEAEFGRPRLIARSTRGSADRGMVPSMQ